MGNLPCPLELADNDGLPRSLQVRFVGSAKQGRAHFDGAPARSSRPSRISLALSGAAKRSSSSRVLASIHLRWIRCRPTNESASRRERSQPACRECTTAFTARSFKRSNASQAMIQRCACTEERRWRSVWKLRGTYSKTEAQAKVAAVAAPPEVAKHGQECGF